MTSPRSLPAIDALLRAAESHITQYGRPLVTRALRESVEEIRGEVLAGASVPPTEIILARAFSRLSGWTTPTLQPVINATGVILHTNLGRAPLSRAAIEAMSLASAGYTNLEFDLETGKRGSRLIHAEAILRQLTGAEAALVVNNCASAVLLVLSALAKGKKVIIARSQLVEIGGGFRMPDVMKQSGAKLLEVGTTNKIRLEDYAEAAVHPLSASASVPQSVFLHVHRSNFKLVGFTVEPELAEIAALAHSLGLWLLDDLGSGALLDTANFGLEHEPTVQESLAAGADVAMFSGDKLLGGPQAGIILGKKDLLDKIKKHPLARAVRADKTCLAGLHATLLHYLKDEAAREIPIWWMISQTPETLRARAESWQRQTDLGQVVPAESTVGGGSLPGQNLPTWALSLPVKSPDKFLAQLRRSSPPIIARAENERVILDPRTVLPGRDEILLAALEKITTKVTK
ncbi:MAG: L-seryl-tRNA(Sec) selenium transferase [Anaerolineae bacterium CG_4_9_14_3_um_filter_57_17]|nr:L-seryl-tRNA(Sec) selenium transferase [bacterium]NCT21987.1 L-seryl-tRNA(Sec) selenium transferase [bacterium]OIO86684.1 MAG: L-seryl-tRNA(Sec) selenium transferase [Anaerolineae bacterium CG2_30_57_67]PJB64968.1 MAG: L-seryl-tRNA(Sec) selenium transferase [Anaerolineae bacterium CG_4_9_14_3_um_filter_57_17]